MGFEPTTSSLGSWHSTTELLPLRSAFNYLPERKGLNRPRRQSIQSMLSIRYHTFGSQNGQHNGQHARFRLTATSYHPSGIHTNPNIPKDRVQFMLDPNARSQSTREVDEGGAVQPSVTRWS